MYSDSLEQKDLLISFCIILTYLAVFILRPAKKSFEGASQNFHHIKRYSVQKL